MKILKQENWWVWLILFLCSSGTSYLVLGALLDVYQKDAWYARWTSKMPKWLLIALPFLFFLMLTSLAIISATCGETLEGVALLLAGICSFAIMFVWICVAIFYIQILCQTSAKLEVPGHEFYLSPYIWILCLIIPFVGWVFLPVMLIYLNIANVIMLYRGKGEKFLS